MSAVPRFGGMNKLVVLASLSFLFTGCAEDEGLTVHQVCSRLADATCERAAVCEPTLSENGCVAKAMATCCPDGVCDELVIADEPRIAACERAIETMSCSELTDRDMPSACDNIDDPRPTDAPPSDDPPPSDEDPAMYPGVLEVNWDIVAGGTSLSCNQFHGATKLRIHATNPTAGTITREFACGDFSALTQLPLGPVSIRADLRGANGQVIQETTAQTVVINQTGASVSFQFQVTTRFGTYCTQMAETICAACAPTDTTCKLEIYNSCCGDDGTCNRPALAETSAWSQCLTGWGSGQYCTAAAGSPPSCSGSVDVW